MSADPICIWVSNIVLRGGGHFTLIQKNGILGPLGIAHSNELPTYWIIFSVFSVGTIEILFQRSHIKNEASYPARTNTFKYKWYCLVSVRTLENGTKMKISTLHLRDITSPSVKRFELVYLVCIWLTVLVQPVFVFSSI